MTFEQIIEREWRKAVHDQASMVYVDMSEDETIMVTYRMANYTCLCDSDDEFSFVRQDGKFTIMFPIPADWFNAQRA